MTEIGEGVSIPPPDQPDRNSEEPRKPITVRCSLFFDGTLNNRTNVQHRINNTSEYHATKSLFHRLTGWGDGSGAGSYENDESNVAVMERFVEDAEGYDVSISIYTEGPGSVNHGKDKLRGYAMGTGSSGVERKVEKGLADAVEQIGKGLNADKYLIKKISLDVFGFSRGAAGARYCIHRVLHCTEFSMKERLEWEGFEVELVEISFAGLYDTVSAHGWNFNDVETLHLDAVRHAQKVVHLVAADEHRKNFSLTNIKSAIGKGGEEYYLPGAHSDVGGGYRDNANESFIVFIGTPEQASVERLRWIAEGWYTEDEIQEVIIRAPDTGHVVTVQLRVNRSGISNAYSLIPLKVMARFARDSDLNVNEKLEDKVALTLSKYEELMLIDDRIGNHIARGIASSTVNSWSGQDPLLRKIRHDHLHVSSNYKFGMKSRLVNGVRQRGEYDG